MKSNMTIDGWMDKQLNDYLDAQDSPCGSFSFRHKVRGGWANVEATITEETDCDEDGYSTYLLAKIDYCHWCFNQEHEVDLDYSEKKEIEDKIMEIGTDF